MSNFIKNYKFSEIHSLGTPPMYKGPFVLQFRDETMLSRTVGYPSTVKEKVFLDFSTIK